MHLVSDCSLVLQDNASNGQRSAVVRYSARRDRNSLATYRVAITTGSRKNAGTDARVRGCSMFIHSFTSSQVATLYVSAVQPF